MHTFISDNAYDLWGTLTTSCLVDGHRILDESEQLVELCGVAVEVTDPSSTKSSFTQYADQDMVEAMSKNFSTLEPQFGYSFAYGARIYGQRGDGPIHRVRDLLVRKPEAKSATMSLLSSDPSAGHVPCITTLDFKLRDSRLDLYYFARSQDVFKKSYADNLALYEVLVRMADELGTQAGSIYGFIASAHLYLSDLERIESIPEFAAHTQRFHG